MLHRISFTVVVTGLFLGSALLISCDFASRHGSRVNEVRTVSSSEVSSIKIKSISAAVEVITGGSSSNIEVTLAGQTTAVEILFYTRIENGKLEIECREPWGLVFSDLKLTVLLPASKEIGKIDVDVTSGSVNFEGITAKNGVNIDVTSGSVKLNAMKAPCFVKSTSGSTEINYADKAYETKVKGVSGSIRVGIPAAGANFTFKMDSTSGSKECEFGSGNSGTVGSGGPLIDLSTTSGSIRIRKL